ncbi:MAG: LacI family DNA-binding transcriptional regulator [Actinomycetia bacterium]|nr:LacI family DNA-binding transcriptional regulator [Actinomycetes bacterium]
MVTLSDVAQAAGVSLSTASRAINGSKDRTVNPQLREKVLAVAAELRYSPNAAAQAIARGQTTGLSLLVHDIADPYFSSIAAGVTSQARSAGCSVLLGVTNHDLDEMRWQIDQARRHRSRALVMVGSLTDRAEQRSALLTSLEEFRAATGSGVALVSQPLPGIRTVRPANREGARLLGAALTQQGHRRFAVLTGPEEHLTAQDRRDGFIAGLPDPAGVLSYRAADFDRDGGYEAMSALIGSGELPDVVFAVTDVMAVGALAAARERGLRVPGDIAVAGFGDIPTLRDYTPALTTVHIDLEALGETAARAALTDSGPMDLEVPVEVVLRESTVPDRRRLRGGSAASL